jgi:hypothetical protein
MSDLNLKIIAIKLKLICIISLTCFFCINSYSRDTINKLEQRNIKNINFGIGTGMDFGGIGGNLTVYAEDHLGIFVGLGYNYVGVGINGGLKYRILPKGESSLLTPYLICMYGTNAVIGVSNATSLNKVFYGPSFGFGIDWKGRPGKKFLWTIALIVPIRSADFQNYKDMLKSNYGAVSKSVLIPVRFSFGIRF